MREGHFFAVLSTRGELLAIAAHHIQMLLRLVDDNFSGRRRSARRRGSCCLFFLARGAVALLLACRAGPSSRVGAVALLFGDIMPRFCAVQLVLIRV